VPVEPVDPKVCRKNALQCMELAEQAKDAKHATILKNPRRAMADGGN
jgi:hypothetical protein